MKQTYSRWAWLAAVTAAVAIFGTMPLQAELIEKTVKVAGTTVHYKVVLPNGYDRTKRIRPSWRSVAARRT